MKGGIERQQDAAASKMPGMTPAEEMAPLNRPYAAAEDKDIRFADYQAIDTTSPGKSIEDAEKDLLSNLEAQSRTTGTASDGFRPAIRGERPPLGFVPLGNAFAADEEEQRKKTTPLRERPTWKNIAARALTLHREKKIQEGTTDTSTDELVSAFSTTQAATEAHRQAQSLLATIEDNEDDNNDGRGTVEVDPDQLLDFSADIFAVNESLQTSNNISQSSRPGHSRFASTDYGGLNYLLGEDDPILAQVMESNLGDDGENSLQSPLLEGFDDQTPDAAQYVREHRRLLRQLGRTGLRWKAYAQACCDLLHPIVIIRSFWRMIRNSSVLVIVPLCAGAWFLFYNFGNPRIDFLPGSATVSWWMNFIARQLVLFDLARLTEYIIVDGFTMSSSLVAHLLGPWVTILSLQSKGWPFVLGAWSLYAMLLLHGDDPFNEHWLYWTGISIYSHQANSGSYILSSNTYLRVLLGMLIAGTATSIKRTVLTLYFGRRNFEIYKPKLEKLLNDIVLISEVAELAAEAENVVGEEQGVVRTEELLEANLKKKFQRNSARRWSSVKFHHKTPSEEDDGASDDDSDGEGSNQSSIASETELIGIETKEMGEVVSTVPRRSMKTPTVVKGSTSFNSSSNRHLGKIKSMLDRWQDSTNRLDKTSETTVSDILKFRKALTFMDLEHPFGEAFGPASNRDELLRSSELVYRDLMKLVPGSYMLPISILQVLAEDDEGNVDKAAKKHIKRLFRADKDKEIPFLSFLQTCDTVYKELRYFRASVGNSSVIDQVLEDVINTGFDFLLILIILSILNFNPWPLLVSISTLLVSLAFAIGPTAAKTFDGMMLVVLARPFEIGDRIIIANLPGDTSPGLENSWLVEDITLFRTKLRRAINNEVATVSNASIANSRITNCARSKNAMVTINLKFHLDFHRDGYRMVREYQEALETYIRDNPASWDAIIFFRCEGIDNDNEFAMYCLGIRHVLTWQNATRVSIEKGVLHQFCNDHARRMGVAFDSRPPQQIMYFGGRLVNSVAQSSKRDLIRNSNNIRSNSSLSEILEEMDMAEGGRGNVKK